MIIPDANLLLYAYNSGAPSHKKAAVWWKECLTGEEPVGLPQVVIFGFVRIGTNARAYEIPLHPQEAADHVREWLSQPCAQVLEPGPNHIDQTLKLLETVGTAGNLVTDAQIAALAIEYDAVVHTADADFLRFPGVRWRNPITGTSSRGLKKG